MQSFEQCTYYARLEPCAYPCLLVRLSGKQRDKISPGSLKIAIVSEHFTRVTEHKHEQFQSGQPLILTNTCFVFLNFKAPKKSLIKLLECVELYLKSYLCRVPYSVEGGHLLLSGMYEGQS
jgi:hypothetical protein